MPRLPQIDDPNRGDKMREAILDVIRRESRAGLAMTVREIGQAVGLSSSSTVHNHLNTLRREGKIKMPHGRSRSIEIVRKPEEICTCCGGSGWTPFPSFLPKIQTQMIVREYRMSGELLNDEIELVRRYGAFIPEHDYRVRDSIRGREIIGLWEEPGTELIGDKRPPSETSFGH